jgi:hypothetical protein
MLAAPVAGVHALPSAGVPLQRPLAFSWQLVRHELTGCSASIAIARRWQAPAWRGAASVSGEPSVAGLPRVSFGELFMATGSGAVRRAVRSVVVVDAATGVVSGVAVVDAAAGVAGGVGSLAAVAVAATAGNTGSPARFSFGSFGSSCPSR